MLPFEFLVLGRPVSLQTKSRKHLRMWKARVRDEAEKAWGVPRPPMASTKLRCAIVYLSGISPADIDNIIKPILDAMVGLVFVDDEWITDVDGHRRSINPNLNRAWLPDLLGSAIKTGLECVYVRISDENDLQEYLP